MGVDGLTDGLQPYLTSRHLMEFKGLTVGIDGFNWLHQAAFSCSQQLCTGVYTKRYIRFFINRLKLFEHHEVVPYIVFDGALIPTKAKENAKREGDRLSNLKAGHSFLDEGDHEAALKCYRKSFSKASLVFELFEELRKENIKFLVSPYEGDAQLAFLLKEGLIDVALSDDTDLLPYGCDRVIFSFDQDGWVKYFDRSFLGQYETVLAKVNERGKEDGASTSGNKGKSKKVINLSTLNDDQIILYCVMKGCDYFKGLGYPQDKLLGLVEGSDYNETMQKLRDIKLHQYNKIETSMHEAYMTYKHHLVFDPRLDVRRVVNLTEPEESMDLSFLGPYPY